jgi:hypothetical protein
MGASKNIIRILVLRPWETAQWARKRRDNEKLSLRDRNTRLLAPQTHIAVIHSTGI